MITQLRSRYGEVKRRSPRAVLITHLVSQLQSYRAWASSWSSTIPTARCKRPVSPAPTSPGRGALATAAGTDSLSTYVAAARRCFDRDGVAETRMEDIAQEAMIAAYKELKDYKS